MVACFHDLVCVFSWPNFILVKGNLDFYKPLEDRDVSYVQVVVYCCVSLLDTKVYCGGALRIGSSMKIFMKIFMRGSCGSFVVGLTI